MCYYINIKKNEEEFKMTEKSRMLSGKLYIAQDDELRSMNLKCRKLLDEFNETKFADFDKREEIAKKLFKKVGKNIAINKPFYCDYGENIEVGDNFYANFNCTILDVNKVIIGDNVLFGPNVNIYTAGHPIDSKIRSEQLEFGKKIEIGSNVWIGGNVVVNPGVKIGNNVVIGAGAVVVKDIPDNVIAVGNPCKVLRKISDEDKKYWEEKKKEYWESRKK